MSDEFQAALAVALRRLQTSDRFESEVRKALAKHPSQVVDEVVAYLYEKRFLNDLRLADRIAENNEGRRAVGVNRLRVKLERRGAPGEAIQSAVATMFETEPERALDLLRSKFPEPSFSDRPRAGRFLYSRGFEEEVIESALDSYFPEP